MGFCDILKASPDMLHLEPATEESIKLAEVKLGVSFSPEYRRYLLVLGTATAGTHEFTGICMSPRLNVVDVTLKERQRYNHEYDLLYVVEQLHIDDMVIWQSQDGKVYQSMPGAHAVEIAPSLAEYLGSEVSM